MEKNRNLYNKKNCSSLSLKKSQYCNNMNTRFELKKIACKTKTRVRKCKVYLCLKPIQKTLLQVSRSGIWEKRLRVIVMSFEIVKILTETIKSISSTRKSSVVVMMKSSKTNALTDWLIWQKSSKLDVRAWKPGCKEEDNDLKRKKH